jgi:hypothetical protein
MSFDPRPKILSQARRLVCAPLKIFSELLNPPEQNPTLGHLIEIRTQNALEAAEEPKPEQEKDVIFRNFIEGVEMIKDIDGERQQSDRKL